MTGKTISITIPEQLEKELQEKASNLGISRSRFICNLLLSWQSTYAQSGDCANTLTELSIVHEDPQVGEKIDQILTMDR